MKRIKFSLVAAMLLISASGVQAQSIGDLLTGLGKTLVGDKATTAASLKGTWTYTGPACEFESDNLLSKAGGSAVSTKIENKITPVLKKYGVQGIVYTFDGNGNYTTKIKKRTIKGTYTFDSKKKTITFKPHYGKEYTANVSILSNQMTLVFNADKLMHVLQTISNTAAKQNSTAATINTLMKNYNGMRLGFRLKK